MFLKRVFLKWFQAVKMKGSAQLNNSFIWVELTVRLAILLNRQLNRLFEKMSLAGCHSENQIPPVAICIRAETPFMSFRTRRLCHNQRN